MQRYPKEISEFITEKVVGRTTKELVKMINDEFGTTFTESKIQSYKTNHGLKSGTPIGKPAGMGSNVFPLEVREFIIQNIQGIGPKEMTELLNKTFNKNYKASQIKNYYANNKLSSGLTGYFDKDHIPQNKGKKGQCAPGCEKGWFRKGNTPENHKPVGSERIDTKDGYTLIKNAEPNVWELKHKVIYEEVHGKVPDGCVVTFLDGDITNLKIDNLEAITMGESLLLNRSKLRFVDADLTRTGILIVKVKQARSNLIKSKRVSR